MTARPRPRGAALPGASRLAALAVFTCALTASASPLLHERIAPDPRDDLAMHVVLDGDIPAALVTPGGLVSAPDPRRPVTPATSPRPSAGGTFDAAAAGRYEPDRDTRRPDVLPYEEPFTPSTAPFKRLVAFDAVDASFRLVVADPTLRPLPVGEGRSSGELDARFYADVSVAPSPRARVPSVGPGAHVAHARYGSGARDIPFSLFHDSADNWFLAAAEPGRLVMEQSIPLAALGGEPGDPRPGELRAPTAPREVVRAASGVAAAIGLDRTSTRRTVAGLVAYFRGFTDSDEPPTGHGTVYLDLALSKKGVCRHRAYAFTVTALGLGLPARMVLNEAHAWVEVHDGALWRRIDLGGAGRTLDAPRDAAVVAYEPPPDPYAWPPDAESGQELGRSGPTNDGPAPGATRAAASAAPGSSAMAEPVADAWGRAGGRPEPAAARITLEVRQTDARRGAPLDVRGEVRRGREPCPRVTVEVALRSLRAKTTRAIGSLATDDGGRFAGALLVPSGVSADDYEVVAHTADAAGCPEGWSE